jgi:hypothetical protein
VLPLDSPRWGELKTWMVRRPLPDSVRAWREVVSGAEGWPLWRQIYDAVVHQYTLTDAAYAVLPYAAAELWRVPEHTRLGYLLDLGFIEAGRLSPHAPPLPADLAEPYLTGVRTARALAFECLAAGLTKPLFLYLVSCVCNLFGHPQLGRMLWHLDALEPEEIEASGYCADGSA